MRLGRSIQRDDDLVNADLQQLLCSRFKQHTICIQRDVAPLLLNGAKNGHQCRCQQGLASRDIERWLECCQIGNQVDPLLLVKL